MMCSWSGRTALPPGIKAAIPPGMKAGVSDAFMVSVVVVMLGWFTGGACIAQESRFRPVDLSDSVYQPAAPKLVVPVVLIGFGFSQFAIEPLTSLNLSIRSSLTSRFNEQIKIDNYSQMVPAAAVYALNLAGIRGKHNFIDRSLILGTSMAVMGASTQGIKLLTHVQRPDGSSFNSFPSGHTALAFACAEFLYQEYKDVSIWYGIAGYTIAAGTGFMRMYNNRHWFTDVVAGAGFGILSTRLAYWVFPKVRQLVYKTLKLNVSIVPQIIPAYGMVR
jgi:membrane-associated phospholipid phosphatase